MAVKTVTLTYEGIFTKLSFATYLALATTYT